MAAAAGVVGHDNLFGPMDGFAVNMHLRNPVLQNPMLPAEIVLSPAWWHKHEGISFEEDFFYSPSRRVEVEQRMEKALYVRWGRFGLGEHRDEARPEVGPVHLASGFLVSEMLGCEVAYTAGGPPQVMPAHQENLAVDVQRAFSSPAFKRFARVVEQLKDKYSYVVGDANWGGVLNVALDLRGEELFTDVFDRPAELRQFLRKIAGVMEKFATGVQKQTGTSSVTVNRSVRHVKQPVFLDAECSHTMISCAHYEELLLDIDARWSLRHRPFGIHYCGSDPHRYAASFRKIPHLDYLDVGWGGDVKVLREHLPATFLNIRLSPVEIAGQASSDIRETIVRLVRDSANPYLTGVCCINMDANVPEENITAIFETANELRKQYAVEEK